MTINKYSYMLSDGSIIFSYSDDIAEVGDIKVAHELDNKKFEVVKEIICTYTGGYNYFLTELKDTHVNDLIKSFEKYIKSVIQEELDNSNSISIHGITPRFLIQALFSLGIEVINNNKGQAGYWFSFVYNDKEYDVTGCTFEGNADITIAS